MKIKYFRGSFLLIAAVVLVLGIQAQPTAQPMDNPDQDQQQSRAPLDKEDKEKPKYAPDRFIVKFKSDGPEAVNEDVEYLLESNGRFQDAVSDKSDSLDQLMKKHRVRKAKSVFIERHGLTTGDAKKKQNDIERLSKAKHPSRSRRAPKDAVIPDLSNIYVLEVAPESDIEQIVQEYQSDPHVEYAQPDYFMETNMVPNDPYYSSYGSWGQNYDDLWGLKNIQAEQAWDITQGEGIVVAVVDSGVDYNHPDIAANVWTNPGEIPNNGLDDDGNGYVDDTRGWDFTTCVSRNASGNCLQSKSPDNDPMDGNGHGTHVAGTITAVGNNGIGIIGVAPQARIMPLKGLEDTGGGYTSDLATGIRYAAENGADVINNSWGCRYACPSDSTKENAVRTAYSLGAVVVFAAGNSSEDVAYYSPLNMTDSRPIVVSATTQLDTPPYFTNFGAYIDVAAPGGGTTNPPPSYEAVRNILSLRANNTDMGLPGLIVDGTYFRQAGTSMAAPHAAGLAALILSKTPDFTIEEVRRVLQISADDVGEPGFDVYSGAGRLNASKALGYIGVGSLPLMYAGIYTPTHNALFNLGDDIIIAGSAYGPHFELYNLFYRRGTSPTSSWIPIGTTAYSPVTSGVLGELSTQDLQPEIYYIRLEVTSVRGERFQSIRQIRIAIPPIQITTNTADQWSPAISGDRIVWTDYRAPDINPGDIWLYDLSTNTEQQITTNTESQRFPAISGNRIVWADYRAPDGNSDIWLYDLSTNTERQITTNTESQRFPAISGDRIVWMDSRAPDGNSDIWLYDLSTNTERQITTNTADQQLPAISGDRIVWEDYRAPDGNSDIWLYDLSTNTERQITTNTKDQENAAISGNLVVWQDYRNGNWDIYLYDLSTDTERQITTNTESQRFPAISGNRIIWNDYRNGNYDIYLYDLATNMEMAVSLDDTYEAAPTISGNKIVWYDYRKDNYDIYLYTLVNQPPVLAAIGNKSVNEGSLLTFGISAVDPDGDSFYSAFNLPIGASFDSATQIFNWLPNYDQAGSYNVTFKVYDGEYFDSETVTITVNNVNRAPTLSPIGNKTVVEGALLTFDISVIDPDAEALATTVTNLPSGAAFNGKTFSWTPGYTQSGTYNVTFTVTDPGGLSDSETIVITVGLANDVTLSNQTINSGVVQYRAQNSITAGPAFVVDVGADVTFKAGTVIKLEPGFSAKTGSKFRAVPSLN